MIWRKLLPYARLGVIMLSKLGFGRAALYSIWRKLMKALVAIGVLGLAGLSSAAPYFFNGTLGPGSPTFVNPGGDGLGSHYYNALEFTVTVSGNYTFESASPNTTGTPSNALDTFIRVYANVFNPGAPGAGIASNDDFTGTLTVLPGPYAGTITSTATGFTGAQPSSRLASVALLTGTTYFMINTSFRNTAFVALTGTTAQAKGPYYSGINGPGNVTPVPEPASMIALGLGAVALMRRRRAKKA